MEIIIKVAVVGGLYYTKSSITFSDPKEVLEVKCYQTGNLYEIPVENMLVISIVNAIETEDYNYKQRREYKKIFD